MAPKMLILFFAMRVGVGVAWEKQAYARKNKAGTEEFFSSWP